MVWYHCCAATAVSTDAVLRGYYLNTNELAFEPPSLLCSGWHAHVYLIVRSYTHIYDNTHTRIHRERAKFVSVTRVAAVTGKI